MFFEGAFAFWLCGVLASFARADIFNRDNNATDVPESLSNNSASAWPARTSTSFLSAS